MQVLLVMCVMGVALGFPLCVGRSVNVVSAMQTVMRRNGGGVRVSALTNDAVVDVAGKAVPPVVKKMNIANKITVARVLLIPVFMGAFISQKRVASIAIYAFSCFTDLLDGWIARNYDLTSDFGVFLDPVADKLMISTVLMLLVCQMPVWWFAGPVVLVINRELAVSALRAWMAEKNEVAAVQVSWMGKWKTALQMISTNLLLLSCTSTMSFDVMHSIGVDGAAVFKVGLLTFYIATALAVVSGAQYFKAAWSVLKEGAFE